MTTVALKLAINGPHSTYPDSNRPSQSWRNTRRKW